MITLLGGSGFIGSHLASYLERTGIAFQALPRDEPLRGRALGHVIYCIGLTADFREHPADTADAHVAKLLEVIRTGGFESLLYLSSTRLYARTTGVAHEETSLCFEPAEPNDLYGLTKAAGEALVFSLGPKGRVARLSNVYGTRQKQTFLASLIADARSAGVIHLRTALDSEKDYIDVDDVVELLVKIALGGRHRLYNLASGIQVPHSRIVDALALATGCSVEVARAAPTIRFPKIDIARIREEFGFAPRDFFASLPELAGQS